MKGVEQRLASETVALLIFDIYLFIYTITEMKVLISPRVMALVIGFNIFIAPYIGGKLCINYDENNNNDFLFYIIFIGLLLILIIIIYIHIKRYGNS